MAESLRLNLGCCDRKFDGWTGVDLVPPADIIADLSCPWPWLDNSVDEVRAHDVIEHIGDCQHVGLQICKICYGDPTGTGAGEWSPARHGRRGGVSGCQICGCMPCTCVLRHPLGRPHFMNELHRVLRPGARALIETPNASRGVGFWCDPTHVTGWCLSSFKYFESGSFAHTRLSRSYGISAAFKIIELNEYPCSGEDPREQVWKIRAILEAVK